MERWRGKTALVTGGSTGIGLAVVKALLRHGVNVVTCSRNPDKSKDLNAVKSDDKARLLVIKCDAGKEEDVAKMFKQIEKEFQHVDILVNNAGGATDDDFVSGQPEKWRQMIDGNVMSVALCTKQAIQLMQKNKIDGHIVNINSVCGHELLGTSPPLYFLSATKHMVTVMTEAVDRELKKQKSNIKITSLSPGAVDTPAVSGVGGELNNMPMLTAEELADNVLYVLGTPPHVLIKELTVLHVNLNLH